MNTILINRKFSARIIMAAMAVLTALIMLFPMSVSAEASEKLYDNAGLLSSEEADKINQQLWEISEQYGHDVVVVTVNSMGGKSRESYSESFRSANGVGINGSGIIFLVAMNEREWDIYSFGEMYDSIFIDEVRDNLGESLQGYLSEGDYATAFSTYGYIVEKEIKQVNEYGPNVPTSYALPIGVVIGIITAVIAVCVMAHGMKTTRPQSMADNYLVKDSFFMKKSRDIFRYATVTRTKIEESSSSSSGGSSSGGGGGGHSGGSF